MPWRIVYFPSVLKFINRLPDKDRARLKSAISALESYGPNLRVPIAKKVDKNLFELRIKGQDAFRIFYTAVKGVYYLVHVFKKKSQKIPGKELKHALDIVKQLI